MTVRFRVVHPFHPWFGREFEQVFTRKNRHGEHVWFRLADGEVGSIRRAWTDLHAPEPFVAMARDRAHFLPRDLVTLVGLVGNLTAARGSPVEVDRA